MDHCFPEKSRLLASKSSPEIDDLEVTGFKAERRGRRAQGAGHLRASEPTGPSHQLRGHFLYSLQLCKLSLTQAHRVECEWSTQWWAIKARQESQQFNSSVADVHRGKPNIAVRKACPKDAEQWGPRARIRGLRPSACCFRRVASFVYLWQYFSCIAQTGPRFAGFLTWFQHSQSINLLLRLFHMETCITDSLHVNMLLPGKSHVNCTWHRAICFIHCIM